MSLEIVEKNLILKYAEWKHALLLLILARAQTRLALEQSQSLSGRDLLIFFSPPSASFEINKVNSAQFDDGIRKHTFCTVGTVYEDGGGRLRLRGEKAENKLVLKLVAVWFGPAAAAVQISLTKLSEKPVGRSQQLFLCYFFVTYCLLVC